MRAVFTALLLSVVSACHAHVRVEPKSGLEFVHQPGGTFHYGCEPQDSQCDANEKPGKFVTVQPFWLGKTTVTVAAYARCVSAGVCLEQSTGGPYCNWKVIGKENHPMNCLGWEQATAFCGWIGGRLPTAEEWEYAAKGGESRIYPWGNEPPDRTRARFGESSGTAPADSHRGGASRHGLLNMVGNMWQLTASPYLSTMKEIREIRGGSWYIDPQYLRASDRYGTGAAGSGLGVRCAL